MANQGFGALVGNFLQAFVGSQDKKREREDLEKKNKLITQLMEQQLQDAQSQSDAVAFLASKMSGQGAPVPQFDTAAGGLGLEQTGSTPGPQGQGMSLVDLLSDPNSSYALLRSGMLPQITALQGQQMQQQLMSQFLGGGGPEGMELTGFGISPSGGVMPDFGLPQVTTQTIETPEGPRIKTLNVRTGEEVADLGAVGQNIGVEQAGRIQGLFQAQQSISELTEGFIKPDGSVDRTAVLTAFSTGLPFSRGRELSAKFEDAADAVIRARTGATANEEELKGIARQFKPSPLDDDATIIDKLNRFRRFSEGALDVVTLPPRLRELARETAPQGLQPQPQNFEGFRVVGQE